MASKNIKLRDYEKDFSENPRLPEHKSDSSYAKYLHELFPEVSIRTYREWIAKIEEKNLSKTNKNEWDESKNSAVWSYDGTDVIHTLEDALKYSKVDLTVWQVQRHIFNQWEVTMKDKNKKPVRRMNVQVKVWFEKIKGHDVDFSQVFKDLDKETKSIQMPFAEGNGIGVISVADLHFGAEIEDLLRSGKFNIKVLSKYLTNSAHIINQKGYKEVHLSMLGDFIESFTGLNHADSWKGMGKGMFGMNAVILCYEILMKTFVSKINNLKGIYIVSGNHDRVTSSNKEDHKGEVAQLLAYLFNSNLKGVNVEYHPMIITKVIDNICYLFTHGHLGFVQKELSKILFDYGRQGYYNVLIQGHKHSREVKKSVKRKQYEWNDVQVVQLDEVDYRFIIAPPMFTGNFFSESIGYSSSAGLAIMENNGNDKINYYDYCV